MLDSNNIPQKQAFELVENTNHSFFIAGRAGTGKTTFLKEVRERIKKNFLVVAPTGIAAINAGGETIHSAFALPFGVFSSNNLRPLHPNRREMLEMVDTIIIDEVSMVRCDVIDAIDYRLRRELKNGKPFGGKQVVFIGDLFQLEPVVNATDKEILADIYGEVTPFFYNAKVFRQLNLSTIEFKKIYRQKDEAFIALLENVRLGNVSDADLAMLNSRVENRGENEEMIITLTARNDLAKKINDAEMQALDGPDFKYEGKVEGEFDVNNFHTDYNLTLRKGAHVMFTKNDTSGRWVNGTLGVVSDLSQDMIKVRCENGQEYEVEKVTWENTRSSYDKKTRKVEQVVVGSFIQYPLKAAWAITIHKSQGLTFNKVRIDFSRHAFANGQAYVALSRARSLEGLYLTVPFLRYNLKTSGDVADFYKNMNNEGQINHEIVLGKEVAGYMKNKDFDKVALTFFKEARAAFEQGNIDMACQYFHRALNYIACDDSFYFELPQNLSVLQGGSSERYFAEAVYYLYSGQAERALQAINSYLMYGENDVNGLYIRSQALYNLGRINEADEMLDQIADVAGYPTAKINYKGGCINEEKLGLPGKGLLQSCLGQSPKSLECHLKIYSFCKDADIKLEDNTQNPLVELFNSYVDVLTFRNALLMEINANSKTFSDYLKVISTYAFI